MNNQIDFLSDLIDIIQTVLGHPLEPQQRLKVEKQARLRYGGADVYVRKKSIPKKERDDAIRKEYRQGKADEVADKFGVSKSTVFRALAYE